ncbi:MAG: glycine hydroxymethyltransferase, partial [Thermoproteota archaeon]|nr:glycine hydroxymethyltransferase [Thermoproteota archaeon]
MIGNDNLEEKEWRKVGTAIFPKMLSNTHLGRFPPLAITALEMNEFGKDYARQTVRNSKAFAGYLDRIGFDVLCSPLYTDSHQVVVNVREFGGGETVADKLEQYNIICNKMALPQDSPDDATNNPSGIRLGTQELTRFGMKENEMKAIADFYEKILIDNAEVEGTKKEIIDFRKDFQEITYCFKA